MSQSQNLVNQQLAWCSTLIQQFHGERLPWLEEALLQSLTWHLQVAYSAFLQELAESQHLSCERSSSIAALIAVIPGGRGCPAEFDELQALEIGESWLSMLLSRPTSPASIAISHSYSRAADIIVVSGQASWQLKDAEQALSQLRLLIERNRALNQEY